MTVVHHPPYLVEAFGAHQLSSEEDYALLSVLDHIMWNRMRGLTELVDPRHPGGHLGGEPGWSIDRQMEPGEARLFVARQRIEFANAKPKPVVVPDPPADAGPDPTWPRWARFKAELGFPDEFGNPKYPLCYYDAATFEDFLKKILAVYVKYHPESTAQAEQILKHAAYWVEHDANRGSAA